jgi:hypothetical protein
MSFTKCNWSVGGVVAGTLSMADEGFEDATMIAISTMSEVAND